MLMSKDILVVYLVVQIRPNRKRCPLFFQVFVVPAEHKQCKKKHTKAKHSYAQPCAEANGIRWGLRRYKNL